LDVQVDFDDIFVQPDALHHGDIGRFLSVPVRRLFGFVFIYTQATKQRLLYVSLSLSLSALFV